jgi:hypothetical protein
MQILKRLRILFKLVWLRETIKSLRGIVSNTTYLLRTAFLSLDHEEVPDSKPVAGQGKRNY